jgi:hypothetical protein
LFIVAADLPEVCEKSLLLLAMDHFEQATQVCTIISMPLLGFNPMNPYAELPAVFGSIAFIWTLTMLDRRAISRREKSLFRVFLAATVLAWLVL